MNKTERTQVRFELLENLLQPTFAENKQVSLAFEDLRTEVCGTAVLDKPTTNTPSTSAPTPPPKQSKAKGKKWTPERRAKQLKTIEEKQKAKTKETKVVLSKLTSKAKAPKVVTKYPKTIDLSTLADTNVVKLSAQKIEKAKTTPIADFNTDNEALFPTSGVISKAIYYPTTKMLNVTEVKSGRTVSYQEVPKDIYEELKMKVQPGIFYEKHIKGVFKKAPRKILVKK